MNRTLKTAIDVTAGVEKTIGKTKRTTPIATHTPTLAHREVDPRRRGSEPTRSFSRSTALTARSQRPRRELPEDPLRPDGEHDQQHEEVDHRCPDRRPRDGHDVFEHEHEQGGSHRPTDAAEAAEDDDREKA